MGSSDKRRGTTASTASSATTNSSRLLRSPSSASAASVSAVVSSSSASTHSANMVLAPPPRAALSGASSPSPEDRERRGSPAPMSSAASVISTLSSTDAAAPTYSSTTTTNAASTTSLPTAAPSTTTSTSLAAAAHQQNQLLLRLRDERIAHLERELAVMEAEFTRELDKLSASESQTATFWQGKHSALHASFLRADTDLRLLRAEHESLARDRESMRAQRDAARREARDCRDEADALRGQVRGLKEWVSTSTRVADGAAQRTSDEVFGEGMARLGNGLQNWVIVHFRKAKIDLSKASEAVLEELNRLVPMFQELIPTAKVHLLQSLVSRILVETVFEAYFIGLSPEQAEQIQQTERLLATYASAESMNQWRASTLAILKKDAATKMQSETAEITDKIVARVNELLDSITDSSASETREQGLKALVHSAIDLARLLVVQRAVFKVTMPEILPHQRTLFDQETMEDIGGEDEESLADREICCVTFPGIVKRGDENGDHLQFRNVISKARVLCSPE